MSDPGAVRFWGVVPAAGQGSRMGAELPKQYLPLAGLTVIEHTLGALLDCGFIDRIVVVLHPDDTLWQSLPLAQDSRLLSVTGGTRRCDSVLAGLHSLQGRAAAQDWVLVHDAARPCVRRSDVQRLRDTLAQDPVGGLLAVPVADTVKQVDAQGRVQRTLDRNSLWLAQTPQMFRFGVLLRALEHAAVQGAVVTDEASAVELAGELPRVVKGSASNIKLTRPSDMAMAENWLQSREN